MFKTWWKGNLFYEESYPDGDSYTLLEARAVEHLTPEQAVEATLVRGTCKVMRVNGFMEYIECSECGYRLFDSGWIDISEWNFCPNCGRRIVETHRQREKEG